MHAIPREDGDQVAEAIGALFSPLALSQVKFLSSDSPSSKLFLAVKACCPNLVCISLDPVHLAIVYEHAQWGKRSPGSKALRRLLRKFTQVDPARNIASWDAFFRGAGSATLDREEAKAREEILTGVWAMRGQSVSSKRSTQRPLSMRESRSLRVWLLFAGTSRKKSPEKSLGRTRKLPRFFGLQRRRRGWSGCSTTSESGMP